MRPSLPTEKIVRFAAMRTREAETRTIITTTTASSPLPRTAPTTSDKGARRLERTGYDMRTKCRHGLFRAPCFKSANTDHVAGNILVADVVVQANRPRSPFFLPYGPIALRHSHSLHPVRNHNARPLIISKLLSPQIRLAWARISARGSNEWNLSW